jgi:hypothetical protein
MVQKTILHSIFYASVLIFYNSTLKAQAPNLGTASSFGVFTAVGAFNNTGTTLIVGDAGTNSGAYNDSPIVTGVVHVVNATSANAATDLATAYNDITALTCDSVIGTSLGGNQTLSPNVYCIGAATGMSGDLYLDAQNDSTALFVFQIDGALSAANFSNIILINKASSCNVFWQVNGQVDIGDSSNFKGIIVANGAINLLEGAFVEGKALSVAGAISLHSNTVSGCQQSLIALPNTFLSFKLKKLAFGATVAIEWQIITEDPSSGFEIERLNNNTFEKIGFKKAKFSNDGQIENYLFIDYNPLIGDNYYRIRYFDARGTIIYSSTIVAVYLNSEKAANIFPIPCVNQLRIEHLLATEMNTYQFQLTNLFGVEILNLLLSEQLTVIDCESMPSGFYTYRILKADTVLQNGKLLKL